MDQGQLDHDAKSKSYGTTCYRAMELPADKSLVPLVVRISGSGTTMVKIQHLGSLFTLFRNNLISAC